MCVKMADPHKLQTVNQRETKKTAAFGFKPRFMIRTHPTHPGGPAFYGVSSGPQESVLQGVRANERTAKDHLVTKVSRSGQVIWGRTLRRSGQFRRKVCSTVSLSALFKCHQIRGCLGWMSKRFVDSI